MTGQQLKNSILQMAVQGKLVPQGPNDEPASVLLERIRKEKEQLIKDGKIKKEKNPSYIFRGADNLPYEKVGKNEPVCIADEVPFEIPESWEWVRLGSISTYSHTKQKINAQNADPKIWGLDLEDIEKGGRLLVQKSVGERKAVGNKTFFDKGDILYSKLRPYLLKILIAPDCGICTPEIVPFKVFGKINPEYIVAFLKCPYVDAIINSVTYGIKMPRVSKETMTSLLVPIPPLSEQMRIVNKLNEVQPITEKYSAMYIQTKTLDHEFPELLKKSILQEAVQGKLVPQDPSDEPASVLLERIRAEKDRLIQEGKIKRDKHESVIYRRDNSHYEKRGSEEVCIDDEIPFEIPENWCWSRLSSLCKSIADGDHQAPPQTVSGIPFIVISNVSTGKIDFTNTRFVPQEYYDNLPGNRIPHRNDILFTVTGSYGIVIPVDVDNLFCFQRHIALLKPLQIATNFLATWLSTPIVYEQCKNYATGTAQKTVSLNSLKNILIPVPPAKEQERILKRLKNILHTSNHFVKFSL